MLIARALIALSGSTMRPLPLVLACASVLAAPVRSLTAQATADTTTASFHHGEWGAGFIVSGGVTNAGVLRFSTPTLAWVLDGSASWDRGSASGSGNTEQTVRSSSISAQLGPRWYHAMSGHATRYLGFGASGAYSHGQSSASPSQNTIWSVGAYGEAGMQYMLTRWLGIGWRGTLSGSRGESKNIEQTGPGVTNIQQFTWYHAGLDAVQLTGTIYF